MSCNCLAKLQVELDKRLIEAVTGGLWKQLVVYPIMRSIYDSIVSAQEYPHSHTECWEPESGCDMGRNP